MQQLRFKVMNYLLQNILITIPSQNKSIERIFLNESGFFYKVNGYEKYLKYYSNFKYFFVDDNLDIEATLDWTPMVTYQYLRGKNYSKTEFMFVKV